MDNLTILTNNHFRPVLAWQDLNLCEQSEYDYLTEEEQDLAPFIRYLGNVYCLGDMEHLDGDNESFPGWQFIVRETAFSGVLFEYHFGWPTAIAGRYYA